MIKTLSKKFVFTAMTAVSILLILLIGAINTINIINMNSRAWESLETISRMSDSSKQNTEGIPTKPGDPDNANNAGGSSVSNDADSTGSDKLPDAADNDISIDKPYKPDADNTPDAGSGSANPSEDNNNDAINPSESDSDSPRPRERNEYDIYMGSNFFFVAYDESGEVINTDVSRTSKFTESEAVELADGVIESGEQKGKTEDCIYMVSEFNGSGNGTEDNSDSSSDRASAEYSVVFLDTSDNRRMALSVLGISLLVGLASWILMLIIILLLSKRAIKPIAENMERQKQFITNAGHELKTPLAIIQSNADAMQLYNGESKWSNNIKLQVERLSKLTNDLLTLARMDEETEYVKEESVNLSEELEAIAAGFEQSCNDRGLRLNSKIDSNVILRCCRSDIEKLISILIDNAIKYGRSGSDINIILAGAENESSSKSFRKAGNNRKSGISRTAGTTKHCEGIMLSVENECDELPPVDADKLFERFYRSDAARTQESGGCGIGLSMAKSIVESHGGTICAEYRGKDSIIFKVIL